MKWFCRKRDDPDSEYVYVRFGGGHEYCKVQYDADSRPIVLLHREVMRLDEKHPYRDVIWMKRRK